MTDHQKLIAFAALGDFEGAVCAILSESFAQSTDIAAQFESQHDWTPATALTPAQIRHAFLKSSRKAVQLLEGR
jgi:hypothetical protein